MFETTYDIAINSVYNVLSNFLIGEKPVEVTEEEFYKDTLSKKIPLGPAIRLNNLGEGEMLETLNKKYGYLDKKYIGLINRSKDYLSAYDKYYGFIEVTMDDDEGMPATKDAKSTINVRIFVNPYYIESSTELTEKHVFETLILILRLVTSKYQTEGIFAYTTSASRALTTCYYIYYGNIIDFASGGDVLTKIHSDKHISVNHTIDTIQTMIENYNSTEILKFLNKETANLYTLKNNLMNKLEKTKIEYETSIYKINKYIENCTDPAKKLEATVLQDKYTDKYKKQKDSLLDSIKNTESQINATKEYFDYIKLISVKIKKYIKYSYFKFTR